MRIRKVVFIKIGGGVITDKHQRYGLRPMILSRIAGEISRAYKKSKDTHFVIGNGAGSFAHWSANKYKTAEGFGDEKGRIGAGIVHHDAVKLNQIVTEELLKHDIPAFSFSPSSMIVSEGKVEKEVFIKTLENSLILGMIPVVYGDVVLDSNKGSCIFSTEKVFSVFAKKLAAKGLGVQIVHVSREDGVLANRKVISQINEVNYQEYQELINGSGGVDVTGGMTHKVLESLDLAKSGIRSLIINGLKTRRLEKAILGEKVIGTLVT